MEQINLFSFENQSDTFSYIAKKLDFNLRKPGWPDDFGKKLKEWTMQNSRKKIRTLSLFSGAGGLDIGFSDAGFEIVESVEVEEEFCKTLEQNSGEGKIFPKSKVNCIDIRKYSGKHLGKIDFIIGGPPCQTFSAAGRRSNGVLGTTDERGTLFEEYVRLLEELSPKGFLFENVYGIIGARGGEDWKGILQAFSEVGYRLYFRILDAADYGVPQHRERLIIIGLQEGEFAFPKPTHGPDSSEKLEFYTAGDALSGIKSKEEAESNRLSGKYAHLLDEIPPGLNYSFFTEEMGHPRPIFAWRSKFSDFLYKADPMTPVRTIKASGGAYTGPLHWENRFFYYEEYKRLQTFPDDYAINGTKKIAVKQIGNSVPPQLARILAMSIREQVFQTNYPFKLGKLAPEEELNFRKRKRQLTKVYRAKATEAIKRLTFEDKPQSFKESRDYFATLTKSFEFKESPYELSDFKVSVNWDSSLTISVSDSRGKKRRTFIELEITSRNEKWNLGIEKINLSIQTDNPLAFTAAWKALERELIDKSIKADLVQLNGYYQYESNLNIDVKNVASTQSANLLRSILQGNYISKNVSTGDLAFEWQVDESKVKENAIFLKKIGYEIRNSNTNPQIKSGEWLIPYPFPTLTPLSVQLWKNL